MFSNVYDLHYGLISNEYKFTLSDLSDMEDMEILYLNYFADYSDVAALDSITSLRCLSISADQKSEEEIDAAYLKEKHPDCTIEIGGKVITDPNSIEKIVVHAPDKSSGHRVQQIDILYRFNVAVLTAVANSLDFNRKRKAA